MAAESDEITVVLGEMETLLRRINRVGFFRPVINVWVLTL